jgi:DNA-binding NarL/FixJ family response regulator
MSLCEGKTAVLVDQHPMWLDAVEVVVRNVRADVVAKTTSTRNGLALVEQLRPDLLVTGIAMPPTEFDGIELIRRAREKLPGIRPIVVSVYEDSQHVDTALAAGAVAYVVKTAHPDDLGSAIRQAFTHSIYLPAPRAVAPEPADVLPRNLPELTRRELEILRLVAEGYSNAKLAAQLWVTEQTVKFHLSNIYRKLDVSNRTEASRWAQLHGVVSTLTAGAPGGTPVAAAEMMVGGRNTVSH